VQFCYPRHSLLSGHLAYPILMTHPVLVLKKVANDAVLLGSKNYVAHPRLLSWSSSVYLLTIIVYYIYRSMSTYISIG